MTFKRILFRKGLGESRVGTVGEFFRIPPFVCKTLERTHRMGIWELIIMIRCDKRLLVYVCAVVVY